MVVSNSLTPNNRIDHLLLDIQGDAAAAHPGARPVERIITLQNRGMQVAEVELWLAPIDLRSEPVKKWSRLSYRGAELILQPQSKLDITLLITVPSEAEAGFYSYEVCAKSPQYPNSEVRKSQQLHVMGEDVSGLLRQDPHFELTPSTTPSEPYTLAVGETLKVRATVENRSRRTDRYFLALLDVPTDWFSVEYPESNIDLPGLITRTDGLQLNPGEMGEITLSIHPPSTTPAGQYFPTVQLSGSNRDEIVLLEVVYLSIPIDDSLLLSLTPERHRIPPMRATFETSISNVGNIHRHLSIRAEDEAGAFAFTLTPSELELPPNRRARVIVEAKPKRWLSRLCHRHPKVVPFEIAVDNVVDVIVDEDDQINSLILPNLPKALPKGTLDWQAYRQWLFWLVLILGVLGVVSCLSWLFWYFLIWRPNLRPSVVLLSTTSDSFQELGAKSMSLNWDVTNPSKVGSLQLSWEGEQDPVLYSLEQSSLPKTRSEAQTVSILLPAELSSRCTLTETVDQSSGVLIGPLLRLHRKRTTGSENLQVLRCREVPPAGFEQVEGEYEFMLKVFSQENGRGLKDVERLDKVKVAPSAPPTATELVPGSTFYRRESNGLLQPMAVDDVVNVDSAVASSAPVPDVPLSWTVTNAKKIKALRLGSVTNDATQNLQERTFDFSNGVPAQLDPYCRLSENVLSCAEVPTGASELGYYNFYLQTISTDEQANSRGEETVMNAVEVAIAPPLPEILSFTHNGASAASSPKRILQLKPNQPPVNITLSWTVDNAVQVELLPAPGVVSFNSISYPVTANAGTETVTLQAMNEAGDVVSQSIVIEKIVVAEERE
ncbi:MAG: hypothetical protein AAFO84_08940 [Cyanobacteria bacterium J06598_1]